VRAKRVLETDAMQFGIYLVRCGALAAEDFVDVVERRLRECPPLGMLAIEERKLTMKQLFAVLQAQAESPRPFGQLAIELGFLTNPEVLQLVGLQSERCRPMAEHLVEMGMLDAEDLRERLQLFHELCRTRRPDDDDENSVQNIQRPQQLNAGASSRAVRPPAKRRGAKKKDARRASTH
jgi:hypothetical protein